MRADAINSGSNGNPTADGCNHMHTCLLVKRAGGEALLQMISLGFVFVLRTASPRVSCLCLLLFIVTLRNKHAYLV